MGLGKNFDRGRKPEICVSSNLPPYVNGTSENLRKYVENMKKYVGIREKMKKCVKIKDIICRRVIQFRRIRPKIQFNVNIPGDNCDEVEFEFVIITEFVVTVPAGITCVEDEDCDSCWGSIFVAVSVSKVII